MRPRRNHSKAVNPDYGKIELNEHNEASGSKKVMIVEPSVVRAVVADEIVGAGRYVKISAAGPYSLKCLGRDYDSGKKYQIGDIAVQGGKVYICNHDGATGAFDSDHWIAKANATVPGIPANLGDVISIGRWHNAIDVAGFLVEDDTSISWSLQRS